MANSQDVQRIGSLAVVHGSVGAVARSDGGANTVMSRSRFRSGTDPRASGCLRRTVRQSAGRRRLARAIYESRRPPPARVVRRRGQSGSSRPDGAVWHSPSHSEATALHALATAPSRRLSRLNAWSAGFYTLVTCSTAVRFDDGAVGAVAATTTGRVHEIQICLELGAAGDAFGRQALSALNCRRVGQGSSSE